MPRKGTPFCRLQVDGLRHWAIFSTFPTGNARVLGAQMHANVRVCSTATAAEHVSPRREPLMVLLDTIRMVLQNHLIVRRPFGAVKTSPLAIAQKP
jgi:hypothetical protein